MAKKTAKKNVAATKATGKKAAAKKTAAKKRAEPAQIVLDPEEEKAFGLAHSSAKVRTELELAVTLAISQSVRKIFKQHGVSLTPPQAQQVAMVLFGD